MSYNCNHPTCYDSPECRRSPPIKKTYSLGRSSLKASKGTFKKKSKIISQEEQNKWFLDRAKECTGICCNCGGPSAITSGIYWKWAIAHVFPKEEKYGFPSIATHPNNFIELCIECHTLYDRSLHVAHTLTCWKFAVEKFELFKDYIEEKSRKYLGLFIHYADEYRGT